MAQFKVFSFIIVLLLTTYFVLAPTDMLTLSTLANNVRCFSLNLFEFLLNIAASLKNVLTFESESVLPFSRFNAPSTESIMPTDYFAKGRGTQPLLPNSSGSSFGSIWKHPITSSSLPECVRVASSFSESCNNINNNFISSSPQTYLPPSNSNPLLRPLLANKHIFASKLGSQNGETSFYTMYINSQFSKFYWGLPGKVEAHYGLARDIAGSDKTAVVVATTSLATPELVPTTTLEAGEYLLELEKVETIQAMPEPLCEGYITKGKLPLDPITHTVPQKLAQKIMIMNTAEEHVFKFVHPYTEALVHKYNAEIDWALNELLNRLTLSPDELLVWILNKSGFNGHL